MKLHYSQTGTFLYNAFDVLLPYEITLLSNIFPGNIQVVLVLLPYEITLLSNRRTAARSRLSVLLPYEITLLSNRSFSIAAAVYVLLPYEITLLSNNIVAWNKTAEFYYLMKLHYSQTPSTLILRKICFTTL